MVDSSGSTQLPGARVAREWERPDSAVVAHLGEIPAAVVADCMYRTGAMGAEIRSVWRGGRLCGPALTVLVRSGDNARIHEAMGLAKVGDVLVVNAQGSLAHAVFGELMATRARAVGIAGLVVDGAVRDVADLELMKFPVFSVGSSPGGPTKEGTGEVGYPVACGRVVVNPGDIVLADDDGVVVVPREASAAVLAAARERLHQEAEKRVAAQSGRPLV
jgi:RraA family protein